MSACVWAAHTGRDRYGCRFAAGVLCLETEADAMRVALGRLDAVIDTRNTRDPAVLDETLADALRMVCPQETVAAALTIRVWQRGASSGGVIGRPDVSPVAAAGSWERLAEDLWCIAYPGGPGLVLAGEQSLIRRAAQAISICRALRQDVWEKLQPLLDEAEAYLYVTDGSGSAGVLAAGGRNGRYMIRLDEEERA